MSLDRNVDGHTIRVKGLVVDNRNNIDAQGLGERIREGAESCGMTYEALASAVAESTGASTDRRTVWTWIRKGVVPEGRVLLALPGILEVSGHWLLTGHPPMKPEQQDLRAAAYEAIKRVVEAVEAGHLSPDFRMAVEQLATEEQPDPPAQLPGTPAPGTERRAGGG